MVSSLRELWQKYAYIHYVCSLFGGRCYTCEHFGITDSRISVFFSIFASVIVNMVP